MSNNITKIRLNGINYVLGIPIDTVITQTGTNPVAGMAIYNSQAEQDSKIDALQASVSALTTANGQQDTLITNLQTSVSNLTVESQTLTERIKELEARP